MHLYLARHGQPETPGRYWGHAEVNLGDLGRQTSGKVAASLKSVPLDLIITSPQRRAVQTARMIALSQNSTVDVTPDPRVAAKDYGIFNGYLKQEVAQSRRALGNYVTLEQKWFWKPPNGESYFDVSIRVMHFLYFLQSLDANKVLVVTHESTLKVFSCILNTDHSRIEHPVGYGAVLQFEVSPLPALS